MNIDKYPSNVDNYKQFSEYALTIYKFMIGFIDKYGILTVDWIGYIFGLNKDGKPISQQSADELGESIRSFGEQLKDPEIREAIISVIKDTEPIVKEAIFSFLNVALGAGEFILKDAITFICSDTPAAPVCGIFKFANNTIEFGQDMLDTGRASLHTVSGLNKVGDKLYDNLETIKQKMDSAKQKLEGVKQKIQLPSTAQLQSQIPTTSELSQNVNTNTQPQTQTGGAKAFKKKYRERKQIETRVNKSLKHFFHLNKSRKTRRRLQAKK